MSTDFFNHFSSLEDPRIERNKEYSMESILFITVCAVFSGCTDWEDIAAYGRSKEAWLSKYVPLPNGVPSHDTINRLFSRLKPSVLQQCFLGWVKSIVQGGKNGLINIDGKRLCNGGEGGSKSLIHLVNAWSSSNQMILGQVKIEEKSNEITAIPTLLDLLELEGAIVTIDAMGCQTEIAQRVVDGKGNYVLAVKGNQGYLFDDLKEAFAHETNVESFTDKGMGHGRIEKRTCSIITDLDWVSRRGDWKNLKCLVRIQSERIDKKTGETQAEQRFYIASMIETPKTFNKIIREHWGIENQLHWSLDVIFGEDNSTKQAGNAAENFSMLTKSVLSIMKNDQTLKGSIKRKLNQCGWNNQLLENILFKQF